MTVLVGANGTGKSNLIKALLLISKIPDEGLGVALASMGGALALIPRAKSKSLANSSQIEIEYDVEISRPPRYDPAWPTPMATHELHIRPAQNDSYLIANERVLFTGALELLASLEDNEIVRERILKAVKSNDRFSEVKVRVKKSEATFETRFGRSPLSRRILLDWLGVPVPEDVPYERKALEGMLSRIFTRGSDTDQARTRSGHFSKYSLFDPKVRMPLDYSRQASGLRWQMQNIRRYDLLLNELRAEQHVSATGELGSEGQSLPGALRLLEERSPEKLERLKSTLCELAPFISGVQVEPLRSAKEFIQFVEKSSGRPVESWDSSDGTLRALGLLVALELQPKYTTAMIEEPELNLHPWAVRTIMRHVRDLQEANKIQVLISTHSPFVLEHVAKEEVFVVERTLEAGTTFTRVDSIAPLMQSDMVDIGRLWVKGLLRGVPSAEC
jgi:predicted ATPase